MNKQPCAREEETLAATHSGAWSTELQDHVNDCSMCGELKDVASLLLQEAALTDMETVLPGSELVWRRAQLSSQRAAITQASRPIAIATNASCLGGVVAMLWFLLDPTEWKHWMGELGSSHHGNAHVEMVRALDVGTVSLGIIICFLLCVGIAYLASSRTHGHFR
jgi:hypothetical protein